MARGTTSGRSSARSAPKRKRLGHEKPRIYTPPLRPLTRKTTHGYAAIEFAEAVLEITLLPWQKWLLLHALELNEDGTYRFKTVLLLVARQNGKSTLMQVLTLWRMFADGAPLVIGTAQSLDIAEEQWRGAVELAEAIPELAEQIEHIDKTNGKKALRLLTGERYKVAAASRRGGRGLSGDLVLLDELREHQNWQAWSAVTKTTMARPLAQIWAASNAGDLSSIVLRHLRSLAHRALGYPDGEDGMVELPPLEDAEPDESLGIFEWSARPDRDVWDREGWAEGNPSLGHTVDERSIAASAATDPEWVFRTEVLCQFVSMIGTGPFPAGAWVASLDTKEDRRERKVRRDESRPATYGIDMSHDRSMVYIAIAFWDTEGRMRVELAAQRPGPDWLVPWLKSPDRKVKPEHIAFQRRGAPVSSFWKEFTDAGLDPYGWEGHELAGWHGLFFDLIASGVAEVNPLVKLTHGEQPALDVAASSASVKDLGDGWVIDRKASVADPSPLVAAIAAVGLLTTNPAPAFESAYENGELLVLD
ncbi:terminase [Microbacterium caowuchunii]|uniref:Terminase n=1 Tax=Microbacterium caowuchunii TaxID=2614638 RepID=A0A5N0TF29_9MICO|nr:terminase [Microbacterium caowuchunii]KAA9133753.1 terminase [Microbacterium caowuchunii]